MTREQLLRQIESARRQMQELAKLYPGCFDKRGRPLVAVARLPLPKDDTHEHPRKAGAAGAHTVVRIRR